MVACYGLFTIGAVIAARPLNPVGEFAPVGLLLGAMIVVRRRDWRWVLPLGLVVSFLAYRLSGDAVPLAAVNAGGTVVGLAVVVWLLYVPGRTPDLKSVAAYLVALRAFGVGSMATATVVALGAWGLIDASPLNAFLTVGYTHLCAYLVISPLFLKFRAGRGWAGRFEVLTTWSALVILWFLAFVVVTVISPVVTVTLIPTLCWMALRFPSRHSLVALLLTANVATTAAVFSHGSLEPLVHDHHEWLTFTTAFFLVMVALSCVPFAVTTSWNEAMRRRMVAETDRIRRVVDSVDGVAIIGTDAFWTINLFNPAAEQLLGYRRDDVMGQTPAMFHRAEEVTRVSGQLGVPDSFADMAMGVVAVGAEGVEIEFMRADGVSRMHHLVLSPVLDYHGDIAGFVLVAEDITDRLATMQALETALQRERASVLRLREIDEVKDTFVSTVSHELRTPLTNITGYLELLTDGVYGEMTPPQAKALDRIDQNSRRLLLLINDLLVLSQMEQRELQVVAVDLDLRRVVADAFDVVKSAAEKARVVVHLELPPDPAMVHGQGDQLEQVMVNLLGNAVKFSRRDGEVLVRILHGGDHWRLDVVDSGVGILLEEQDQLFTRFFRSSTAHELAIQGSGLGLSIARAIVERHEGRISLVSHPDEGTTVSVELPLAADQPAAVE